MNAKIYNAITYLSISERASVLKEYHENECLRHILENKGDLLLGHDHYKKGQITQEELQVAIPFLKKIRLK